MEYGVQNDQIGISVDKLILFLTYVINCSDQAKTQTEKIKVIVKAAVKFLNMNDLSWEKIHADVSHSEDTPEGRSQSMF